MNAALQERLKGVELLRAEVEAQVHDASRQGFNRTQSFSAVRNFPGTAWLGSQSPCQSINIYTPRRRDKRDQNMGHKI